MGCQAVRHDREHDDQPKGPCRVDGLARFAPKIRPRPSGALGPIGFPDCPSAPAPRSSARSVITVTPGPGCGTACGMGRWKPRSGTTGRSCDSPADTWNCASQPLPIRSPRLSTWRTPGTFCKKRCVRFRSRPAPNLGGWWRVWTQSFAAGPCPTHTPTGTCGGMANGGTDASTTVNSGGEGLQPVLTSPEMPCRSWHEGSRIG